MAEERGSVPLPATSALFDVSRGRSDTLTQRRLQPIDDSRIAGTMAVGGPFGIILGPIFYIVMSVLSLSTFKIMYTSVARLAYHKRGGLFGDFVQPALRNHVQFFESIFGQPATFTPSVTHVLLVAIMLVLMMDAGRRRQ